MVLALPKAELHIHLEGSLSPGFLYSYAKKQEDGLDLNEYSQRFVFKDFAHFIKLWINNQKALFHSPDFAPMIYGAAEDFALYLKSRNIIYAEAHVSPVDSAWTVFQSSMTEQKDWFQNLLLCWDQAISQASSRHGVLIRLIVDLVKNYPQEISNFQWEQLKSVQAKLHSIFALGLGGGLTSLPISRFQAIFAEAKAMGFCCFAHAGELLPYTIAHQEIQDSILIGVNRIGHGVHIQDMFLIETLIQKQIGIEINLGSNLATQTIRHLDEHPFWRYLESDLLLSINSDDPGYFNSDLNQEFERIQNRCTPEQIKKLLISAWEQSFAPKSLKETSVSAILRHFRLAGNASL